MNQSAESKMLIIIVYIYVFYCGFASKKFPNYHFLPVFFRVLPEDGQKPVQHDMRSDDFARVKTDLGRVEGTTSGIG